MKVILLSYDKNHEDLYHTIMTYEHFWPTNEFVFRVPWNNIYPAEIVERFGNKIEPIKTSKKVVPTINNLLKGLDDNDWVLWKDTGNKEKFAREIVWYGRKGGKFINEYNREA